MNPSLADEIRGLFCWLFQMLLEELLILQIGMDRRIVDKKE